MEIELKKPKIHPKEDIEVWKVKLNSKNPRTISNQKLKELTKSIERLPQMLQARPIITDMDYVVLGGNQRLLACTKLGFSKVPVVRVENYTKEMLEEVILIDNVSFGEWDKEKLKFFSQESIQLAGLSVDVEEVDVYISDMTVGSSFSSDVEEEEEDDSEGPKELATDEQVFLVNDEIVYKTTNLYDIPQLRDDMLAEVIPTHTVYGNKDEDVNKGLGFCLYNNVSVENMEGNILHFYQDDYRFQRIRQNASVATESFVNGKLSAIVSPDFSCRSDSPIALQIYNVYRSMRCARTRQEAGLKIIPSILYSGRRNEEFTFIGLPKKIPVISFQVRTGGSKNMRGELKVFMEKVLKYIDFGTAIVYGGYEIHDILSEEMPKGVDYIPLMSWNTKKAISKKKVLQ